MLRLFTMLVVVFLLTPILVVFAVAFTELDYISFPPKGFTLRWFTELGHRREFVDSFLLSLSIATVASIVSTVLGSMIAIALSRYRFKGRDVLTSVFLSPLILPGVVIGLSLLQFYSKIGLSITFAGLLFGHIIITAPYAVRLIIAGLASTDPNLEWAAMGLGAPPLRAFLSITAPLMRTAVIGALFFTFIASFDNVTISVFLANPGIVTLPVRIYTSLEFLVRPNLAALSVLIIAWNVVFLVILERLVGVEKLYATPS